MDSKLHIVQLTEANSTLGTTSWKSTSDSVRRALELHGCVVVDYDNVHAAAAAAVEGGVFGVLKEVFGLPLETKMKHKSGLLGFGYEGNYPEMPLFQCFGIEDGGTHQGIKDFTTLMWPHHHGHDIFCETIHSYSNLLSELHNTVMKMVVSSYGLDDKYYDNLVDSSLYMTRLIEYRPPGENESDIGLQSHRDKGFLTVIGTNEVRGLQIETPGGEWIDFEPSPSKFLVLAGEAFMAWSNGRIYSPLHRVVARGAEMEIRYSVGFFSFIGGILQVPEELVDNKNPLKFKPFNNLEFLEYCKNGGGPTTESAIITYCGI
ncbi:hypothetical protein MIMGU_mgv1a010266mg [Erythranthe guttata]|uniref:Fe2OG dioxygenase domain-containing protein n=1 Tax=Erythranthe guttata TaxID=4155 RepID=A0A022Q7K0_ERYGU|nr:PREDICTED: probable 2-oxoglutarate-dependent dioxygenase AOP1 [Erythranthe guttata]EYU24677.1 hypothetical protein MIMGU_mgv1a010266mg [Erythranthe guttata]|eukprot:XP_012852631.1 PREDICTED: probable 2-oxoglutarate-dependent dioxygenase AOP1 [Erythranthe guttata]